MTRIVFAIAVAGLELLAAGVARGEGIPPWWATRAAFSFRAGKRRSATSARDCSISNGTPQMRLPTRGNPTRPANATCGSPCPAAGEVSGWAAITGDRSELNAQYVFTPEQDVVLTSLHVSVEFSIPTLAGGRWTADQRSGTFPQDFGEVQIFRDRSARSPSNCPRAGICTGVFPSRLRSWCRTIANGGPRSPCASFAPPVLSSRSRKTFP